ncbi:MAG: helix-turn-helix transcriptional regulator [Acidobacteriota bacterium]
MKAKTDVKPHISLGERLKAARGKMLQKQVAGRASIDTSTYSSIERNEILPAKKTLDRILDGLSADTITKSDCRKTFNETTQQDKVHRHFSTKLNRILSQNKHITPTILAESNLNKSVQVIRFWLQGTRLPSGETLNVLTRELEGRGASKTQTKELRVAHIWDTVFDDSRLNYLTVGEKQKMLEQVFGRPKDQMDRGSK